MRNDQVLAFLSILLFLMSMLYTKVKTKHLEYNDKIFAVQGFIPEKTTDGQTVLIPAYTEVHR